MLAVAVAIVAVNVSVLALLRAPHDGTVAVHDGPDLTKDTSNGTAADPFGEPDEVHEDVEGPVPQDEGKG